MKKYLTVILLIGCCFISCNDVFVQPDNTLSASNYGTVLISFSNAEARTVLPSMEFDNYVYTFTKTGGGAPAVLEPDQYGLFTLEIGQWYVEVKAYAGAVNSGNLAAFGVSKPFTLGSGAAVEVDVTLEAVSESSGTGTFSYAFTYPAGAVVERLTLTNLSNADEVTLDPLTQGNAKIQTLEVPAGYYLFTIRLNGSDLRRAGISEVVHIYTLATTEYEKAFVEADFSHNTVFLEDFDISGTEYTYDGDPKSVNIEPRAGKSPGNITVYYEGTSGTVYPKNNTPPVNAGTYIFSFNVQAAPGFAPATVTNAGIMTINKAALTINITPPSGALTPLENLPYTERTGDLTITLSGFLKDNHANYAGIEIQPVTGLSFSGYDETGDAVSGAKTFNVSVTYNGTQKFAAGSAELAFGVAIDNQNYTVSPKNISINICDGQTETTAIPVTQANLKDFIAYAGTSGISGGRDNKYYKQVENITLPAPGIGEESNWMTIEHVGFNNRWVFDGDNKTISGLSVNTTGHFGGLFDPIGYFATVKNVRLEDVSITDANSAAVIAANNYGNITNCTVNGNMAVKCYFGMVLDNVRVSDGSIYGTIADCSFTGNITIGPYSGDSVRAGGIAGFNEGTIKNCINNGTIEINASVSSANDSFFGGVVGANLGILENCKNTGNLKDVTLYGTNSSIGGVAGRNNALITGCSNSGVVSGGYYNTGGIVGNNQYKDAKIKNCFNTGEISGRQQQGGIVGNNGGNVSNSFNAGKVSGNFETGGVVGRTQNIYSYDDGTVENCYNTGDVIGQQYTGGITGQNGFYIGASDPYWGNNLTNCFNTGKVTGTDYVGGLTGSQFPSPLGNSVALCTSITALNTDAGRITGQGVFPLTNNYARNDMTVTISGVTTTPSSSDPTSPDGADVLFSATQVELWWRNTAGWDSVWGTSDSAPWQWDSVNKRPKLYFEP